MVQCLETWLLADWESLQQKYDRPRPCFRTTKLKKWPNLEKIPRNTLQDAIEHATANCRNPYSHADGNVLIAVVDREKLKTRLSSVKRLFKDFAERIEEYAAS